MKPTDFSKHLTDFLSKYMPGEKGASVNTIKSYRDTFMLFLEFCRDVQNQKIEKLTLSFITMEIMVQFLNWLEGSRGSSHSSRNVRLAAIRSFFRYLQYKCPDNMNEWQRILSIPVKKSEKPLINYLSVDGMRLVLAEPDTTTQTGRRDLALLALMYDSGARVQEIIDLKPSMIRLEEPYTVKLIGKGRKARIVPLLEEQVKHLKIYMKENRLLEPYANEYPLFMNRKREKLTRMGVGYILEKYVAAARQKNPSSIPDKISCHGIRHSSAMHMLQAGVNLVYIRDILGHSSIQVTEVYARADSKQKREAIEKAYTDLTPTGTPSWHQNDNLLQWLKDFNR